MNSETATLPLRAQPRKESLPLRLLRGFVRGNYFYIFSAALMMLGSYLLMHSPLLGGGIFMHTLKTLAVLEGYQILVITTALIIFRRLRVLSDAAILLIIELTLLLDPTFFANAFLTMIPTDIGARDPIRINLALWAFAPAKLWLLLSCLRLKIPPSFWGSLSFASIIIYLGPVPLNLNETLMNDSGYFYLLSWAPLILALLTPALSNLVTPQENESEPTSHITTGQRRWLPRFFATLPMLGLSAHYLECPRLYTLHLYNLDLAPLLLAASVYLIHNGSPGQSGRWRLAGQDALATLALILSLTTFNPPPPPGLRTQIEVLPRFIEAHIPIYVCAGTVAILYLYHYARLRYRPALDRFSFIVIAAIGIAAYERIEFARLWSNAGSEFEQLIGELHSFAVRHLDLIIALGFIPAAMAAWKWKNRLTWFAAGTYAMGLFGQALPSGLKPWWPEILQMDLGCVNE